MSALAETSDRVDARALRRLRPWYHDFSRLGLATDFEGGPAGRLRRLGDALSGRATLRAALRPGPPAHRLNQRAKEAVLVPWLEGDLAELPEPGRCLDLFCADGYYACTLATLAPGASVVGVDRDERELRRARAAAAGLGLEQVRFVASDVPAFLAAGDEGWDVVLCAGGLYHLRQPQDLLRALRPRCLGALVLQSAVTLETEAPDYFVAPAPGRPAGSRFTHARLRHWLTDLGWTILAEERGELPGNRHARDRGASYFLGRV